MHTFTRTWLLLLFCLNSGLASAQELLAHCDGHRAERCAIYIDGTIQAGATERLDALLSTSIGEDTRRVVLNSRGGDLAEGLNLGRYFRSRDLQVSIGRLIVHPGSLLLDNSWKSGVCLSACAYAFLGGGSRVTNGPGKLGFHMASLQGGADLIGTAGLLVGQVYAGNIVAYLIEMGVDPQIFVHASRTVPSEMYYPDDDFLSSARLRSEVVFSPFAAAFEADRLTAQSYKNGYRSIHDNVDGLSLACSGQNELSLRLMGSGIDDDLVFGTEILFGQSRFVQSDPTLRPDFASLTFRLTFSDRPVLKAGEKIGVEISVPASIGGPFGVIGEYREIGAADLPLLAAVLRDCVDISASSAPPDVPKEKPATAEPATQATRERGMSFRRWKAIVDRVNACWLEKHANEELIRIASVQVDQALLPVRPFRVMQYTAEEQWESYPKPRGEATLTEPPPPLDAGHLGVCLGRLPKEIRALYETSNEVETFLFPLGYQEIVAPVYWLSFR